MNFESVKLPKSMTCRSVFKEGQALPSMKRVDHRCKTGGFTRKSCQNDMISRMSHHVGERRTGIAGRTPPLEHRIVTGWLEPFDPTRERRRGIEKR